MKNILIVDDDVYIGDMLEEALERQGYGVLRAYSGTEALLVIKNDRPDLALLDLMLPGLSGEEVITGLKGIPTVVVSAKTDVDDKVRLLTDGAVDYVTKPFQIKELLARIAVHLRQCDDKSEAQTLCFCDLRLELETHIALCGSKSVRLTRTEYAILKILMNNPTQVITKSGLLDKICTDTPDCTESSLKTHVSHLRAKLRSISGRDYIDSVWGIGFRLKQ